VLEAIRIADRDRKLPDAHRARGTQRHRRQPRGADADHRDVGVRVLADEIRVVGVPVGKARADGARAVHHVAIGEQQPVGREREARAAALAALHLHFEVRHRRRDNLGGMHYRIRIGIEQGFVAALAGGLRRRAAVIENPAWVEIHRR